MRAVIQRVLMAKVEVSDKLVNEIKEGFLIYLGFGKNDTKETIDRFVNKVLKLRIFEDEQGKTNLDLFKINDAKILLISQFTLMANTNLGNRPSFTEAMEYNSANELYLYTLNKFNQRITTLGGVFGEDMKISSINNGPFTIIMEDNNDK